MYGTVVLSKNWGVSYRTYVPYRTAILAYNTSKMSCTRHEDRVNFFLVKNGNNQTKTVLDF